MTDADDLYGLSPDDFTRARNELGARLKKEGKTEEAAEIKKLRKPTLALWAVNQTARRYPQEIEKLVALGEELRAAQVEGRPDAFRAAAGARTAAVAGLLDRVRSILSEVGGAVSHAERAGRTIEAAAADADARRQLLAGALREEIEPEGFGGLFGQLPEEPPPDAVAERRAEEAEETREEARKLAEKAHSARRDALRLEREADEAEATAARARRAAAKAVAAADTAEAEAERAAGRADDLLG